MQRRITAFHTKPRKPLARSAFKAIDPAKRPKLTSKGVKVKKVTRTKRAKKMLLKRTILEQYNLPSIPCSRWGLGKNPTRTDLLKGMLWHVFARYIRKRDQGRCISCGMPKTYDELQGGHYVPVGGNDLELCFSEVNVNGECEGCNAFDPFHLVRMRKNLIQKYGEAKIEELDTLQSQKRAVKWEESTYVELINKYLKLI